MLPGGWVFMPDASFRCLIDGKLTAKLPIR
jgi:hypothetical protein